MHSNQSPVMASSSPASTAPTTAAIVQPSAADEGSVMDEFDLRLREESESIPSTNRRPRSFPPLRLPLRLGTSPQQSFALPLPTAPVRVGGSVLQHTTTTTHLHGQQYPPHHHYNAITHNGHAPQQQQQQTAAPSAHGSSPPTAEDDDMWALIAQSVAKHSGVKTPTSSADMEELLEVFMREIVRPSSATLPGNNTTSPRQSTQAMPPPQDGRATIVAELQWAAARGDAAAVVPTNAATHPIDGAAQGGQQRPGKPLDAAAVVAVAAAAPPPNTTPRTTLTPRNGTAGMAYHHHNKYSSPVLGVSSATLQQTLGVSSPRQATSSAAHGTVVAMTATGCPRPRASKANRQSVSSTAAARNLASASAAAAAVAAAAQRSSSAVLRSRGKHVTKSASSAFSECSTTGSTADISSEQSHQTKGTAMSF